ncbi:helix-turn-helix transcriptional regulator [Thermopolyspora sp. NPDC052614]|uniref:helix-turn-helix transcriptional regulator n=1 Tax=Thermopolyspora sp. NPDC052614 TaxID=3155682 RepID=UPI00342476DA
MGRGEVISEYVVARPAPGLRGFVSEYAGYRMDGPPGRHHGLPSPYLTLVVCLSGDLDVVEMPDPGRRPVRLTMAVGGLHETPVVMAHDGRQYGVQIGLTLPGARALLGVPAGELSRDVIDMAALLGRRAGELAERLAEEPDWRRRFGVLDRVFAELARDGAARRSPDAVARAWGSLIATGGNLRVGELARDLGWSRRHLTERFRREVGLTPKAAARVIRFARACRMLRSPCPPPLARVAADCGYFDQAHLAREFRELAGVTATTWLADPTIPRDALLLDGEQD